MSQLIGGYLLNCRRPRATHRATFFAVRTKRVSEFWFLIFFFRVRLVVSSGFFAREKTCTINLPLNRCRWAFLLIIMIINLRWAARWIPSDTTTNASPRLAKQQAENENTKNLALMAQVQAPHQAHTFAKNEFILQHSRCRFLFAWIIFFSSLFLWDAHQQQQHRRLFFFAYLCVQIRD